jgi:hypothetical protein
MLSTFYSQIHSHSKQVVSFSNVQNNLGDLKYQQRWDCEDSAFDATVEVPWYQLWQEVEMTRWPLAPSEPCQTGTLSSSPAATTFKPFKAINQAFIKDLYKCTGPPPPPTMKKMNLKTNGQWDTCQGNCYKLQYVPVQYSIKPVYSSRVH